MLERVVRTLEEVERIDRILVSLDQPDILDRFPSLGARVESGSIQLFRNEPSITATVFTGPWARLNLLARGLFFLAIPVQELTHLLTARWFGLPREATLGSLWSQVRIDYSRAPPHTRAIVRLAGPAANLTAGLLGLALFGTPSFDLTRLLNFTTFTSLFTLTNLILAASDTVLSMLTGRGDVSEAAWDLREWNEGTVKPALARAIAVSRWGQSSGG